MATQSLADHLAEFREWARAELSRRQADELVTAPLYHYTDATGLTSMVRNEAIWFTDIRHLNDPDEMRYGVRLARDVINEQLLKADGEEKAFMTVMLSLLEKEKFTNGDNDPNGLEYFVACFSRDPDDLGQWRAYGANGRGFALGMSPDSFQPKAVPKDELDGMTFVSPVVYGENASKERHRVPIDRAVEIIRTASGLLAAARDEERAEFARELVLEVLAAVLVVNCLTSKHEAYAHENEVRLVVLGLRSRVAPFIELRVRGSEIVPYIEYPVKFRTEPGLITEIVAGPASHADAVRTVGTFIQKSGVTPIPSIRRSGIPYRAS